MADGGGKCFSAFFLAASVRIKFISLVRCDDKITVGNNGFRRPARRGYNGAMRLWQKKLTPAFE